MFLALVNIYAGYVYYPGIFGALGLQCALGHWPGGKCGLAFGVGVVIGDSLTTLPASFERSHRSRLPLVALSFHPRCFLIRPIADRSNGATLRATASATACQ